MSTDATTTPSPRVGRSEERLSAPIPRVNIPQYEIVNTEKVHSTSQRVHIIPDYEDHDMNFQGQGYGTRQEKPKKLKPTTHAILVDTSNNKIYGVPIKYIHKHNTRNSSQYTFRAAVMKYQSMKSIMDRPQYMNMILHPETG